MPINNEFAAAVETNGYAALHLLVESQANGRMETMPGFKRFTTGVPFFLMNGFLGADLPEDAARRIVRDEVNIMKARELPFMWMIGPSAQPQTMAALLEQEDLKPIHNPGMWIDLDRMNEPTEVPGIQIREVDDEEDMARWTEVLSRGYGIPLSVGQVFRDVLHHERQQPEPRFHHFLALQAGIPAACSSLVIAAGQAGVYNVATVKEARRQGIGAAVTVAALQAGRALGLKSGVLFASKMGYPIYEKLGFRTCCTVSMYAWHGDAAVDTQGNL
jgi:GNAT superfamily N-acetyltransferase